jgi:hypothetical protein
MVKIEKAQIEHFEDIYKLLLSFKYTRNTKNDWKNIFIDHFQSEKNYYGYILKDGERIVGFINYLFAKRKFNGKVVTFCNIGSWIVLEKYRNKSLSLLMPLVRLNDCILTNFTASKTVYKILKTLKFKEVGDDFIIILPIPGISFLEIFKSDIKILYGEDVKRYLKEDELVIYNDHSNPDFKCKHILLKDCEGICYIIAKKAYRNQLPFLHIHYIGNSRIFSKYVGILRVLCPFYFKVLAIIVDKRFLGSEKINNVISDKLQSHRLCKPNLTYSADSLKKIDHLYSEFIVLHI